MILETYRKYRTFQHQLRKNAEFDIRFFNFWEQDNPDMWFYRFIKSRRLLDGKDKKVCFFSTFGPRNLIKKAKGDVNVFFTGENLKRGDFTLYTDHFLNEKTIDLALGFELFEDIRYMRFPLWLMYMFSPDADDETIKRRCLELRYPQKGRHLKFASHISRDDSLGIRTEMCNELSKIRVVDCAGKLLHNCDDLWKVYSDDKMSFISEYKFSICPENSNCAGYVTEKVFQAIDAGCVPIYWGSYNNPEPEVLNRDAILFWEKDGDNSKTIDLVARLEESPTLFKEFSQQARLKDGAEDFVLNAVHNLERRVKELI